MSSEDGRKESVWKGWWLHLQEDRGARAELRRCGSVAEAAFVPAYHSLRKMKGNPEREHELKRLGLIAAVLAHVEEDVGGTVAALMATPDGEKSTVSDARFRQLLRTDDADDLLRELVRVLKQLGGKAPVHRLAEDLWWWNERTRRDWALAYYEIAAPKQKTKDE